MGKETHQTERATKVVEQKSAETVDPLASPFVGLSSHSFAPPPNNLILRQKQALQLQNVIGNQSAQRHFLQRDEAPNEISKGLDASMLNVVVTQPPSSTGQVTATTQDKLLLLNAPEINYKATVSLSDRVTLGNENGVIKVGPVQTLVSSTRTGVYKKGGVVVAEYTKTLASVRDARPLSYHDDANRSQFVAESPFYDRHQTITDSLTECQVHFMDRPTFPLPLELGGGHLAAVRGSDNFNTSIGAKREGAGIITLNPFGWGVDWTLDLAENYSIINDAEGNSIAKGISIWKEFQGIAIDSPMYAKLQSSQTPEVMIFHTLEAAMSESPLSLLGLLLTTRAHDPAGVAHIEEALRQKNPTFNITVTTIKTATSWGDDMGMFAHITKQTELYPLPDMDEEESRVTPVSFNSLCDPASIQADSQLSVWVGGEGEAILGDSVTFPLPFLGSKTVFVSSYDKNGGEYLVSVKLG